MRSVILSMFACATCLCAQDKQIDTQHSTITIHVGKAGLFSIAGHEHWVDAPISSGVLNDSDSPRVEFRVETAKMMVKPDPNVDSKTQADIQKDMQEMTLETARYPEIVYRSTRARKRPDESWDVQGVLTLHGVSKLVGAVVSRSESSYQGRLVIRQTDFGIKPVSVGGGVVKVKNELDIAFQIAYK